MTEDEASEIVARIAAQLGEHFDAVQVMVTSCNGDGTFAIQRGCGNWYARQGMAHEFINDDEAQTTAFQIAQHLHD